MFLRIVLISLLAIGSFQIGQFLGDKAVASYKAQTGTKGLIRGGLPSTRKKKTMIA
jgi:hypothetical protein